MLSRGREGGGGCALGWSAGGHSRFPKNEALYSEEDELQSLTELGEKEELWVSLETGSLYSDEEVLVEVKEVGQRKVLRDALRRVETIIQVEELVELEHREEAWMQ